MASKRILVTGSGGPLGVNVTRSIQAAPEEIYTIGTECNEYHTHLSITDKTLLIPPAKNEKDYLEALLKLIEKEKIQMILPTHPLEVRTISKLRQQFEHVKTCLPNHQTIKNAQNKWQTYLTLRKANVPVPHTRLMDTEKDLRDMFSALSTRPIWVRGAGVPGAGIGVASLPCREVSHAHAWIDHWEGWGKMIASEFLPGRNLTWCGLFNLGTLIASQTRERLEYVLPHVSPSGITGAPAVSRTIKDQTVSKVSESAVRALVADPHGVFFVDLKGDSDGAHRVTEINAGRFGTTIHFYTEAGCNFPYLLIKLAYGEPIPNTPIIDPIQENTYWIRTLDCGPVLVKL